MYLAVSEKRRTVEHAELLVKKAEKRTQRKLKLLVKSFDYKKQNILEEVEEVKNEGDFGNFEKRKIPKKEDFESNTYNLNHHKNIPVSIKAIHTKNLQHQ